MSHMHSPIGSLNLGLPTLPTTTADYFSDNSLELQGAKDAEAPRAAHYQYLYKLGYSQQQHQHVHTPLHSSVLTESHQIHNNSEHLETHLTRIVLYSRPPGDSVLSPLLPLTVPLGNTVIQPLPHMWKQWHKQWKWPIFPRNVSEKTQEQENYIIQPECVS